MSSRTFSSRRKEKEEEHERSRKERFREKDKPKKKEKDKHKSKERKPRRVVLEKKDDQDSSSDQSSDSDDLEMPRRTLHARWTGLVHFQPHYSVPLPHFEIEAATSNKYRPGKSLCIRFTQLATDPPMRIGNRKREREEGYLHENEGGRGGEFFAPFEPGGSGGGGYDPRGDRWGGHPPAFEGGFGGPGTPPLLRGQQQFYTGTEGLHSHPRPHVQPHLLSLHPHPHHNPSPQLHGQPHVQPHVHQPHHPPHFHQPPQQPLQKRARVSVFEAQQNNPNRPPFYGTPTTPSGNSAFSGQQGQPGQPRAYNSHTTGPPPPKKLPPGSNHPQPRRDRANVPSHRLPPHPVPNPLAPPFRPGAPHGGQGMQGMQMGGAHPNFRPPLGGQGMQMGGTDPRFGPGYGPGPFPGGRPGGPGNPLCPPLHQVGPGGPGMRPHLGSYGHVGMQPRPFLLVKGRGGHTGLGGFPGRGGGGRGRGGAGVGNGRGVNSSRPANPSQTDLDKDLEAYMASRKKEQAAEPEVAISSSTAEEEAAMANFEAEYGDEDPGDYGEVDVLSEIGVLAD